MFICGVYEGNAYMLSFHSMQSLDCDSSIKMHINTKNLNGLSGLAKKVLAHLVEEQ